MRKRIWRKLCLRGGIADGEYVGDALVGGMLSWSAVWLENVVSEVFSVSANKGLSQCQGISLDV